MLLSEGIFPSASLDEPGFVVVGVTWYLQAKEVALGPVSQTERGL